MNKSIIIGITGFWYFSDLFMRACACVRARMCSRACLCLGVIKIDIHYSPKFLYHARNILKLFALQFETNKRVWDNVLKVQWDIIIVWSLFLLSYLMMCERITNQLAALVRNKTFHSLGVHKEVVDNFFHLSIKTTIKWVISRVNPKDDVVKFW